MSRILIEIDTTVSGYPNIRATVGSAQEQAAVGRFVEEIAPAVSNLRFTKSDPKKTRDRSEYGK